MTKISAHRCTDRGHGARASETPQVAERLGSPVGACLPEGLLVMMTKPSNKLSFQDRLSHLTFHQACKLLGPWGRELIQKGSKQEIDLRLDLLVRIWRLETSRRNKSWAQLWIWIALQKNWERNGVARFRRATDPSWSEQRLVRLSPKTLEQLEKLAEQANASPMQVAALLLEQAVRIAVTQE